MLITSNLEIKINNRIINYYKSLGYNTNEKIIVVNIKDVPKNSGRYVTCLCDDCGKEMEITYQNYNIGVEKNGKTICNKCNKKYIVNPFSRQEIKDKIKSKLIEKYGVDNPLKCKNIKDKRNKTMIEKYGNAYSFDNKEIKEKMENKIKNRSKNEKKLIYEKIKSKTNFKKSRENFEKTMLEKYGVKNSLQNEDIKKLMVEKINNKTFEEKEKIKLKIKESNLNLFGVEHPMQLQSFKEKSNKTKRMNSIINFIEKHKDLKVFDIDYDKGIVDAICEKHGKYSIGISAFYHRWNDNHNMCVECNHLGLYVKMERDILNFIKKEFDKEIITHTRKILKNELELDIYLPDLKLAFEFNGLYWHSEIYKNNNYHLNKTEDCEKQNIQLIHIYEDDWIYKQDIVKSRILNLLGKSKKIMARKCEIKEINDNKIVKDFLEINHLQGFIGSKIKIGLFYNDEVVSLMTFGNLRKPMNQKSISNSYEMLRFCNKLNINVTGGASRLFKYFIEKYKPNDIISYADRSWSQGGLYEKLGFKLIHKTKPNYYYIINRSRKYRFNYRKDKLIKEGVDPNKTEHEIMLEKGIFRIYDSGNLKYIY